MPNGTVETASHRIVYSRSNPNTDLTFEWNLTDEIQSLRTAISSGGIIYANDLNRIAALINGMNGHYHSFVDIYQKATYGNNGDRTTYTDDPKYSSGPDAILAAPTNTTASTPITASRHNDLKDSINTIRNHYHEINDRTTP
jgi:hypothetical protein